MGVTRVGESMCGRVIANISPGARVKLVIYTYLTSAVACLPHEASGQGSTPRRPLTFERNTLLADWLDTHQSPTTGCLRQAVRNISLS
jgi:hypothetical protein